MTFAFIIIAVFFLFANFVSAHQSRIVTEKTTVVQNPEISQAFYGELKGAKNVFEISSAEPFELYVGLLVPDIEGARKDFYVEIYTQEDIPEEGETNIQKKTSISILNGNDFNWTSFYEPFAGDNYFQGPEYAEIEPGEAARGKQTEPGNYLVQVFNPDNEGKYVLAVGTREEFPPAEIINTVKNLPQLKTEFFGKSPLLIFWNLIGLYILCSVLAVVLMAWTIKIILRKARGKKDIKTE